VSLARRLLLLFVVLLLVTLGAVYWLLGTSSGTRWLLAQAGTRVPDGLVFGEAEGSLLHGVRMDSFSWHSETLRLQARDIRLDIELLPLASRHLVIESLAAAELELRVLERDQPDAADKAFAVDLPVDISAHDVSVGRLRYAQRTFDREVRDVRLAGSLRGPRLRLRQAGFHSDWLDLDASGTATLAGPFDIDANATWQLNEVEGMSIAGSLHLDGDREAYTLEHRLFQPLALASAGTVALRADGLYADLVNEWQDIAWDTSRGTIGSSRGRLAVRGLLDEFEIELDARVGLDGRPELQLLLDGGVQRAGPPAIEFAYDIAGLDAAYLSPELHGELAARGQLSGVIGGDGADLNILVGEVRGTLNGHAVEGSASARLAGNELFIRESRVLQGDNRLRLQGSVTDPLDVDIEIELNDIEQLAPQAAGSLTGRASVQGSYARPAVDATLTAETLVYDGLAIDAADVAVSGNADSHTISARVQAFNATLAMAVAGQFRQQAWAGTINRLEAASTDLGTWVADKGSTVTISPESITIAPTCLERSGGAGTACLSGRTSAGDSEFDLSVDGYPVAALPLGLPPDVQVTGLLNVSAHATTEAGKPVARAELELVDTALGTTYMDEEVNIDVSRAAARASIVDGRLESSMQFELSDGAGRASANLTIPDLSAAERVLAGDGEVVFRDISLFAILLPEISQPTGRLEGDFTVSGSAAAPDVRGAVRLSDGAFGVRQTGISVTGINLEFAQTEPGRIRLQGTANSGNGTLHVDGFSSIGTGAEMRAEIILTGDDFELARLPDWQVSASPTITAIFDERSTRITGDLAIPRASVTMREAPVSAERPSPDVVVHREASEEPTDRRRVEVDVRTSLGDEVQFAGFGLTSGVTGSVRLRGGSHSPFIARGTVSLVDGQYKAYGQELAIERGELIFNGPLNNPLLDIRAVRKVRDVVAGIEISGTPSRLQSDVFSDPPLSDAEALSYLLTGRPLGATTTADDGEVLNNAAFALGLSGAGLIASQVRAELGLETLTIEGTGDASKLVAGKRLNDRLLVEYGYGLIDKLGTLLLRYQLNERLVLESRTGTVNTFDVVYRRRKK
jgi:translocation and assembly module TamB